MANKSTGIQIHKKELLIGVIVFLISTLAYILGWTNIFTVQDISVTGSPTNEITAQVLQISDIQRGEKLARVEPRKISNNLALAGINWIESVDISRNWLTRKVAINLKARTPIAISGDKYLDKAGVIFTSPIVVSKDLVTIDASNFAARVAAVQFLQKLPQDFAKRIASISTTGQSKSRSYEIALKNGLSISWGSDRDITLKIKIFKAILALPENKKITSMDLTDPTKPSVK
jgi:cell division protein FtsQ